MKKKQKNQTQDQHQTPPPLKGIFTKQAKELQKKDVINNAADSYEVAQGKLVEAKIEQASKSIGSPEVKLEEFKTAAEEIYKSSSVEDQLYYSLKSKDLWKKVITEGIEGEEGVVEVKGVEKVTSLNEDLKEDTKEQLLWDPQGSPNYF